MLVVPGVSSSIAAPALAGIPRDPTAWLTIPALVGPILGPPLGGFLTTYLSWHWVFWINVPISVLGIILVTKYLPAARKLSLFGAVGAAIVVLCGLFLVWREKDSGKTLIADVVDAR